MKRREFIMLLGGAASSSFVSRPFATHAQERMRRVSVLMNATAEEPEAQTYVAAVQQGMQEFGWSVGRNLWIDLRWGGGDADLTRRYAAELAALSPDVMLAAGGPVVRAVQRASSSVPIVFAQSIDPVGAGIVASLSRPGGNVTGFTQFEYSLSKSDGGLVVPVSANAIRHREAIIASAARHRLPAVYCYRHFVAAGGLISYGSDLLGQYRRAASYVDRILKGEKAADLPVQAPTKYELVVNLKTAKALALDIPTPVLARADEVIE
jgi:ABC-type uncharacterized transport system substrate-binding protein